MKCVNCGCDLMGYEHFCPNCGYQLVGQSGISGESAYDDSAVLEELREINRHLSEANSQRARMLSDIGQLIKLASVLQFLK